MIHIYKNNPTAGGTDGTMVSEGTNGNPIIIGPLDASKNEESTPLTLGIRCDSGYATASNTVITPMGETANMWALSLDGVTWQSYGAPLTITNFINATNTLIYCKAKTASNENPLNDISVKFKVDTTLSAV